MIFEHRPRSSGRSFYGDSQGTAVKQVPMPVTSLTNTRVYVRLLMSVAASGAPAEMTKEEVGDSRHYIPPQAHEISREDLRGSVCFSHLAR